MMANPPYFFRRRTSDSYRPRSGSIGWKSTRNGIVLKNSLGWSDPRYAIWVSPVSEMEYR